MSASPSPSSPRVTLRTLRQQIRDGHRIPVLTCHDATTAAWLWRGGIRCLLVGDSAAMVILGHDSSLPIDMPMMLALTGAVRRGAPDAFIMGDMPFGSYQVGDDDALGNAIALLKHGADAVKLEVDAHHIGLIKRMSAEGIPVIAHIGWRPQQLRKAGVRTAVVAGRTPEQVTELADLAQQLEAVGAVMLLIEQTTAQVAEEIVKRVSIPVIGCGAGPACHGHVVVLQDLLGMTDRHPSFVHPLAHVGPTIQTAASEWVKLVESGEYLKHDHPYEMKAE